MSLETLSSSTSKQVFRMRSKPFISSEVVITKPPSTAKKCVLESESRRFPRIKGESRRKKVEKKSVTSSDSLEFWLKPGISLPKLHSKNVPEEREEPRKVFPSYSSSNLPSIKTESESCEILSADPVKCFRTKSDSYKIPPDVVGPSSCQLVFDVPSSEINLDKLEVEEKAIEEDNALKNWRKWTQRHKKQQTHIKGHLTKKKAKFGLLLQRTDSYRQALEGKILLAECEIPIADKWRGHPYRWALAPNMHGDSSTHLLQKTHAQKGIVSDLEFIGIPDVIKREKYVASSSSLHLGLIGRNLKIADAVAEERIHSFLKLRHRNRPRSANFCELAVVGTNISRPPEVETPVPPVVADVPVINVIGPENEPFSQENQQSVFCLVINGVEINYELGLESQNANEESRDFTWELDFGVNEIETRVEKTLQIENKGTVAVCYKWISKTSEPKQNLSTLAPKQHEPLFFFNKNSGIFLPGQFYDLKFYYRARKSGVRTETWYMKTTPPLNRSTGCGTIILSAIASGDHRDLKSYILESYLRKRLSESVARYILNVLMEKVASSDENLCQLEYPSLFSKKEIFEYHNPKHYYHSEIVEELSLLFEKIPSKIKCEWDLSFDSLKKLISISAKGKEREYLLSELCTTAKKLLKPNYVFTRKEKKCKKAYNILCRMANFMEADYDYLRKTLSKRKLETECNNTWPCADVEETVSSTSYSSEEKCELDSGFSVGSVREITPVNLIYFQTMLYIKVYHRLCEAVENIVGMLESSKNFESSGRSDYALSKPRRQIREPDFFPCLKCFQSN